MKDIADTRQSTQHARSQKSKLYLGTLVVGSALLAGGCADRRNTAGATGADREVAAPTSTVQTSSSQQAATAAQQEQLEPTGRTGGATMVLEEERLAVQKKTVQDGGVVIRKDVETREVTQPVELRRETVEIERLSPEEAKQRQIDTSKQAGRIDEQEVFIPLEREKAVVTKETQPREVIRAGTQTVTEKEKVDATLRREVAEVERQGTAQQPTQTSAQTGQGQQLEQRIRTELQSAQDLQVPEQQLNQIGIRVQQGTVTLTGTVPSREAAQSIERRVRQVQGVQNVQNQLQTSQ